MQPLLVTPYSKLGKRITEQHAVACDPNMRGQQLPQPCGGHVRKLAVILQINTNKPISLYIHCPSSKAAASIFSVSRKSATETASLKLALRAPSSSVIWRNVSTNRFAAEKQITGTTLTDTPRWKCEPRTNYQMYWSMALQQRSGCRKSVSHERLKARST